MTNYPSQTWLIAVLGRQRVTKTGSCQQGEPHPLLMKSSEEPAAKSFFEVILGPQVHCALGTCGDCEKAGLTTLRGTAGSWAPGAATWANRNSEEDRKVVGRAGPLDMPNNNQADSPSSPVSVPAGPGDSTCATSQPSQLTKKLTRIFSVVIRGDFSNFNWFSSILFWFLLVSNFVLINFIQNVVFKPT